MALPATPETAPAAAPAMPREATPWSAWGAAVLVVAIAAALGELASLYLDLTEIAMILLLGIVVVASRWGQGPAILASGLSVVLFDLCFVPPYLTFDVADVRYLLTFVAMFVVGVVVSTLTARARDAAVASARRERRMSALYALGRDLSSARTPAEIAEAAARHVEEALEGKVLVLLPDANGRFEPLAGRGTLAAFDSHEGEIARWVLEHQAPGGFATEHEPGALGTYVPLRAGPTRHGVLGILSADERLLRDPERWQLLAAACDLVGLALERVRLAREAEQAELRARAEEMRNALLSSVSHDLRTPLAAVTGASSALLDIALPEETRRELVLTIHDEMERLNRRVGNLLDMGRLQGGELLLRRDWCSVDEIVGSALRRMEHRLAGREIATRFAAEMPLVRVDETLLETVVVNLVENALKYTPPLSPVEIAGEATAEAVLLRVADRGPGLSPGMEERIFEKFVRAPEAGTREGAGLGLAICRGIVEGHGGRILARNREGGGALFEISLPREAPPPRPPAEAPA